MNYTYELVSDDIYRVSEGTSSCEYRGNETDAIAKVEELYNDNLNSAKQPYLKQNRDAYQMGADKLKAGYSSFELDLFDIQQSEWKTWYLDNTSSTPFVDSLATARGIDRLVLLGKIGTKVLEFSIILGQQHAKEDAIKAATSIEELEQFKIPTY